MFAVVMILIFGLSSAPGFNGQGERGRGKEDTVREHGGKPAGPSMHQPPVSTQGRERPSQPASGGYTKPSAPDHRQSPKLDAVKPPADRKPGDGHSKPSMPGRNQQIRPEATRPSHDVKPPVQQPGAPDLRHVKPPQVGQPPTQHPAHPAQGPHVAPGAPVHGVQPHAGQGHREIPTPDQVQNFLKLPKPEASPSRPGFGKIGAAALGGAAGAVALDHFVKRDKPAHGGQDTGMDYHPGRRPNPQDGPQYDARRMRETYGHRYQQAFDEPWMKHHDNLKPYYWHSHVWPRQPWNYWWRPATWVLLTSWIPWNWPTAVYYDYGNNLYYENGYVILNGQRLCRADEYYRQAVKLVSNIPSVSEDPGQWMPLGVFALKPASGEASDMILQLAVNKDGLIEGTYYNATNDTAKPVKGIVERKSQRAVWTFADDQNHSVILETGIYNLTQDETKVLVHFGRHRTEEWLLVRLQEPRA